MSRRRHHRSWWRRRNRLFIRNGEMLIVCLSAVVLGVVAMLGISTAYTGKAGDRIVIETVDAMFGVGTTLLVLGIGVATRSRRRRSARLRPTL